MSTGDIDDTLVDPDILPMLRRKSEALDAYLRVAWTFTPVRTFFIPNAAGISIDGKTPFISYDIQTTIRSIDCSSCLVRHETTEWGLRKFCGIGEDYLTDPSGHRIANTAEAEHAAELLSLPLDEGWDLYSEIIDPQVVLDERLSFAEKPIPRTLDLYSYTEAVQRRLRQAMWNTRSQEEWERLYA
jgi:hypothetical protein